MCGVMLGGFGAMPPACIPNNDIFHGVGGISISSDSGSALSGLVLVSNMQIWWPSRQRCAYDGGSCSTFIGSMHRGPMRGYHLERSCGWRVVSAVSMAKGVGCCKTPI
jgi:hypothetical protein